MEMRTFTYVLFFSCPCVLFFFFFFFDKCPCVLNSYPQFPCIFLEEYLSLLLDSVSSFLLHSKSKNFNFDFIAFSMTPKDFGCQYLIGI